MGLSTTTYRKHVHKDHLENNDYNEIKISYISNVEH